MVKNTSPEDTSPRTTSNTESGPRTKPFPFWGGLSPSFPSSSEKSPHLPPPHHRPSFLLGDETASSSDSLVEGIARELLDTPFLKDLLRQHLLEWEPEAAPSLLRALLWQDPQVFFSLAFTLPTLLNAILGLLEEALAQTTEQFTPAMLEESIRLAMAAIDKEGWQKVREEGLALLARQWKTSPALRRELCQILRGPVAKQAGSSLNSLLRSFNQLHQEDPQLFRHALSQLLAQIDTNELAKATRTIAHDLWRRLPSWASSLWRRWRSS